MFISIRYTERVNPHVTLDTLIRHLAPLVGPGLERTMLTFEQLLRNEERTEGLREGRREGRREGQLELLLSQLAARFGSLHADLEQRVTQASSQEIERWGQRILTAASLDDVFAS